MPFEWWFARCGRGSEDAVVGGSDELQPIGSPLANEHTSAGRVSRSTSRPRVTVRRSTSMWVTRRIMRAGCTLAGRSSRIHLEVVQSGQLRPGDMSPRGDTPGRSAGCPPVPPKRRARLCVYTLTARAKSVSDAGGCQRATPATAAGGFAATGARRAGKPRRRGASKGRCTGARLVHTKKTGERPIDSGGSGGLDVGDRDVTTRTGGHYATRSAPAPSSWPVTRVHPPRRARGLAEWSSLRPRHGRVLSPGRTARRYEPSTSTATALRARRWNVGRVPRPTSRVLVGALPHGQAGGRSRCHR